MSKIFHIHIPQCGGTWLNHNLHLCLTPAGDWMDLPSETDYGLLPQRVVRWEREWLPPPSGRVYMGDIGHRTVSGLSKGCEDDARYSKGVATRDVRIGTRWWNPVSGIGDEAMMNLFNSAIKIAVCRNPFKLMYSRWKKEQSQMKKRAGRHSSAAIPFYDFLKSYFSPDTPKYKATWEKDLFSALYHEDGSCGINFILRNENLSAALGVFLLSQYNTPFYDDGSRYRDTNMTYIDGLWKQSDEKRKSYQLEYDNNPGAREIIEQNCSKELKAFGYNFEGRVDAEFEKDCDCELALKHDHLFAHTCRRRT